MSAIHTPLLKRSCPVCHYTLAAPLFDGGDQPLATLGWPSSAELARNMDRYPLRYIQCPRCTHIWNFLFSYDAIPYASNPNRMFNKGGIWQGHLQVTRDMVLAKLPKKPTVIDIGCGEGHFIRGISEALGAQGYFLGFDPNVAPKSGLGVEFHARYFDPVKDIPSFEPDLIIMRHVLEHLTDPAAFLDQLAWGAAQTEKSVHFFAEMPCIDKGLSSNRLVDFFYEHPSQFTTQSFRMLMERGGEVLAVDHGYCGEVVYGVVRLSTPKSYQKTISHALAFESQSKVSRSTIQNQLKKLVAQNKNIAIWGGTGKAAAFIHFFEANSTNFPLVVDSDLDKVGTYVPGSGQIIQYRDVLKENLVDIIIIPSQWRAKDIMSEMNREGILVKMILVEHDGMLQEYLELS